MVQVDGLIWSLAFVSVFVFSVQHKEQELFISLFTTNSNANKKSSTAIRAYAASLTIITRSFYNFISLQNHMQQQQICKCKSTWFPAFFGTVPRAVSDSKKWLQARIEIFAGLTTGWKNMMSTKREHVASPVDLLRLFLHVLSSCVIQQPKFSKIIFTLLLRKKLHYSNYFYYARSEDIIPIKTWKLLLCPIRRSTFFPGSFFPKWRLLCHDISYFYRSVFFFSKKFIIFFLQRKLTHSKTRTSIRGRKIMRNDKE